MVVQSTGSGLRLYSDKNGTKIIIQDPAAGGRHLADQNQFPYGYYSLATTFGFVLGGFLLAVVLISLFAAYRRRKNAAKVPILSYESIQGDTSLHRGSYCGSISLYSNGGSEASSRRSSRGMQWTSKTKAGQPVMGDIDFTVPRSAIPLLAPPQPHDDSALYTRTIDTPPANVLRRCYSLDMHGAYNLGQINPQLYKNLGSEESLEFPDDNIGRLWFAVEYQHECERLMVTVIKLRNLASRNAGTINCCDPFVRLHLMPDERRYLQSKQKRKTCNPRYDESFCFQVSAKGLIERSLKLSVYDVDRHKKHKLIGTVLYPLQELDPSESDKKIVILDLEKTVADAKQQLGKLRLAMCYNDSVERLTLTILDSKGLPSSIDVYIKAILLQQNKPVKTKKTAIMKNSTDPTFNESMSFKLPIALLDVSSIIVQVTHASAANPNNKVIGRLVFGSYMFAKGHTLEHWNEMLTHKKKSIQRWHSLII